MKKVRSVANSLVSYSPHKGASDKEQTNYLFPQIILSWSQPKKEDVTCATNRITGIDIASHDLKQTLEGSFKTI